VNDPAIGPAGAVPDGQRIRIVDSAISLCDEEAALRAVAERLENGRGGYVCFTNVHAVVTGRRDARFRTVTNESFLSLADGKAVYWAGRARGARELGHVPGPDFMLAALQRFPSHRHYFYGSTPVTLAALVERLRVIVPGLNVCGAYSPPFRPQTEAERREDCDRIRASGAEFVWMGLGAPKQELWMAATAAELRPAILFGVGAAFDFHAGTVRRAPRWLRALGLEWLYRLCQEPRRLWRRYLVTNSLFITYLLTDLLPTQRERPRV
jgi:N-acetylglucosaminyldiphosphoundecaprenol N-acetyl-beta-D-mannosaminyltransferase